MATGVRTAGLAATVSAGLAMPLAACEDEGPTALQRTESPDEADTAAKPSEDLVTVTGVLTGEGVECPALRADDGQIYALLGDIGQLSQGQRLKVTGRVAEMSFCMQGTPLEVVSIERQ